MEMQPYYLVSCIDRSAGKLNFWGIKDLYSIILIFTWCKETCCYFNGFITGQNNVWSLISFCCSAVQQWLHPNFTSVEF